MNNSEDAAIFESIDANADDIDNNDLLQKNNDLYGFLPHRVKDDKDPFKEQEHPLPPLPIEIVKDYLQENLDYLKKETFVRKDKYELKELLELMKGEDNESQVSSNISLDMKSDKETCKW